MKRFVEGVDRDQGTLFPVLEALFGCLMPPPVLVLRLDRKDPPAGTPTILIPEPVARPR